MAFRLGDTVYRGNERGKVTGLIGETLPTIGGVIFLPALTPAIEKPRGYLVTIGKRLVRCHPHEISKMVPAPWAIKTVA